MGDRKPSVLLAFGGNALNVKGHERVHQKEEFIVARRAVENVVNLHQDGYNKIIITHGNGPQVGRIALQQELTKDEFPRQITLDVCVADSQGRIGYIIQNVFDNICIERKIKKKASAVTTQVVVDSNDPAFQNPTKPIGIFYSKEEAIRLKEDRNWTLIDESGKGWRRVVPSPRPIEIIEKSIFSTLLDLDFIAIGAGGGGIPLRRNEQGELRGVEAVIDKDRTSSLLATITGIDVFVILTEANYAYLNFNTPKQKHIKKISVNKLEKLIPEGHFHEGNMLPKIESAIDFIKNGGKRAVIANLFDLPLAMKGLVGTQIYPD